MLDTLSASLKDALKKLAGKNVVDRAAVDELVKDLQRALLSADVNVRLVMELSKAIRSRSLDEQPVKGMSVREHVLPDVEGDIGGRRRGQETEDNGQS